MKLDIRLLALTLALAPYAWSQTTPAPSKPTTDTPPVKSAGAMQCDAENAGPTQTFYLNNASQQSEANEVVTALRNFLNPCAHVFLVSNQSAIVIRATAEELSLVQKLLKDLDRPKKTYRLTYTVTELDGNKRVGTQHFAMIVASGQETVLKQGSKIPIATGSYSPTPTAGPGSQTQFTYLDIGMNFSATLDEFANGVRLRSDVVQSSAADQTTIAGVTEPVIRQSELKGAAYLTPGKPLVLGSLDIPGSTRHLDIEVVMEQLP